jgi:hypothetical protein
MSVSVRVLREAPPAPLPGRGRWAASRGGAALTPGYRPPPLRGALERLQNSDADPMSVRPLTVHGTL